MTPLLTLGIETSCDETAAALYHSHNGLLSNALFSQVELHKQFGGVVPELASRSQLEKIAPIVEHALAQAHIALHDVDVIAVTHKPGLPGSLLVGVCFAKALAFVHGKKLIGVNHLEGHAFSGFLEHTIPFEHLCITASGGHTSLYIIRDFGNYQTIGTTQDDAAGEAFDKIAKLLQLPYPGGPVIERLAAQVEFKDFFGYPRGTKHTLDFSFSGLKTAVLYDLVKRGAYDMRLKTLLDTGDALKQQVASSLLVCVADIFEQKLALAYAQHPHIKAVSFVGGVACNKYIRQRLTSWCERNGLTLYVPRPAYCTDNAAMIAFVGNYKAQQGLFADMNLDILK
jgi:N6-L-threonylcarbamoyladenine synthase